MQLVAVLRELVAILDTPGGHTLILAFIIAAGIALQVRGFVDLGKELVTGALSAMLMALRYQEKKEQPGRVEGTQ